MTVIFMKREWTTLCSCGWCVMECDHAIMEGKPTAQIMGIFCVIVGLAQVWTGGEAYSVSSGQDVAAGAWWSGMFVVMMGLLGFIRSFQCYPWLKKLNIYLCIWCIIISFTGILVDGLAWQEVKKVGTCVNRDLYPYGNINEDAVMSAAYCQISNSRSILGTAGLESIPYECGCVEKNDDMHFPSDDFNCSNTFSPEESCEAKQGTYPEFLACASDIPFDATLFGQNSTTWMESARFCALQNNITSGVLDGCVCLLDNVMEPVISGTLKLQNVQCHMYSLNSDKGNCGVIMDSLPDLYEACVAAGILCLLFSVFNFLVIIRVSLCPGCCVLPSKQVLPVHDEKLNTKYVQPEQPAEAVMINKALEYAGIRRPPTPPLNEPEIEAIERDKTERREATAMYMAWYKFEANR